MTQLYIPSKLNQLANVHNPYQRLAPKALCVCSAGLLRSPTIAKFLTERGYNTRACGTSLDYALIPLSEALLEWADEIHVVKEQSHIINQALQELNLATTVYVYDIPDKFSTFEPQLLSIIESIYNSFKSESSND